ncbi:sulfite exporter TauE/SafE family protein [Bacillus sp. ISL-40]|nr:sulfite exporter TauE/SafE family protein [Bacillus sp. ISL-40]MBT2723763.1 sulfite exporter TauE/SafE family protein [Bacillus sp. ISL-46]
MSGVVAVQVFFAALGGIWAHRNGGHIKKTLILYMGSSILTGSLIGGYTSHFFSEKSINVIFGLVALLAGILMLVPKKEIETNWGEDFNKGLAITLSFIVGIASGVVGAGGSFILVPIMLVVLKIPIRITIATSLAITFISSIGGTIGKVSTGQVPFLPAVLVVIVSLIASPIGVRLGKKLNTKVLQIALATLIVITTFKIWFGILV